MITLPPRSETIVQVEVTNKVTEEIIQASPVTENVLLPRALVSGAENNTAICTILNLKENEMVIETPTIELQEIEHLKQ